jgi:cell division protein FtsB
MVEEIKRLKSKIEGLERDLDGLAKSEYFLEKLARENLGVVKDGEIVIDIKD